VFTGATLRFRRDLAPGRNADRDQGSSPAHEQPTATEPAAAGGNASTAAAGGSASTAGTA